MNGELRLDANEGVPAALPSRAPGFLDPESARRYPDPKRLEAMVARRLDVEAERVVITAGGDDAIDRAVRALAPPASVVLSTEPAFVEYEAAARRSRAEFRAVHRAPDGPLPAEALGEAIRRLRPSLVIFASPDNPGGGVTSAEELGAIAALGVPVVFDCAYSEFAQDQSVYRKALEIPSVIRVGSFSKAWGLAGLRVGWAAASRDLAQAIRDAAPPFATAGTSIRAAMYALENGEAAMERNVARTRLERERLAALLASLGAHTWKAEANFVPAEVRDPAGLLSFLSGRGIRVRAWPGRRGYEKLVRITCPADRDEFGALAKALREAKEYL